MTYEDQTWHYLVRQWRQDGPHLYLQILANGQTDNVDHAVQTCSKQHKPTHVYDVRRNKIVYRNY